MNREGRPRSGTARKRREPLGPANQFTKARREGRPAPIVSDETRRKLANASRNRRHSPSTRAKISASRRAFLEANPDKVPYLLNHYSKGPSYPETYFDDLLTAEGLVFEKQFRVGLYALDFAFPRRMIDLEINGSQHYDDPRIVESDVRRKATLEALGWTVVTVDWRAYRTLELADRHRFISDLLERLR